MVILESYCAGPVAEESEQRGVAGAANQLHPQHRRYVHGAPLTQLEKQLSSCGRLLFKGIE